MSYQRILVPIDFSDDSLNALSTAAAEFAKPGNSLVLLHVMEEGDSEASNPLTRGRMQGVSRAEITDEAASGADHADEHLRRLQALAAAHAGGFQRTESLVQAGQPTERIIETAAAQSIDLVIMGSHGVGGLGKMLFGSTTYDVARKVKCSVLISKRS